jgi:mannosyltransferase OCH1-like enzyme
MKAFCYGFHFFFPNKRFTIPEYSPAILRSDKTTKIPRAIWQTNFTNRVSLAVYLNYLFNRLMSLSYEYHYVSTEAREAFVTSHTTPEISNAFKRLTNGASQADLWRLIVLNVKGGIYMDIDAHLVWPASKIIDPNATEVILENKQHYTNYFMASSPNNPLFEAMIAQVISNINANLVEKGVYYLTGPGALNQALEGKQFHSRFYKYTCVQGSFTNEHFQYIDRPRSKWTYAKNEDLLVKA